MLTVDEKLTKLADNRRKATIFLRSDNKDLQLAREELIGMDAANKAVAAAVDLKVPDPRIALGPSVISLDPKGNPMTDLETQKLGSFCSVFEIEARLI
jgi:hypothetical protein